MTLKNYPKKATICFILLLITSNLLFAHGELTARINEKTTQINEDPNNAVLHFERGFLYQQHEEYKKALKDYQKSKKLGFTDKLLYYRIAETYQFLNKYDLALASVDSYFEIDNNDVKIYKLQAQILVDSKMYIEAKKSYDYVLENTIDLRPEDIVEYCEILLLINPTNYKDCLDTVKFGLEKMGENSVTLRNKKIEYLTLLGESEKVIEEYNSFIETAHRKEFWYYKKAKYLLEIDRKAEANIALQQAKMSIQLLNPRFQQTPNIKELTNQITKLEKTLIK